MKVYAYCLTEDIDSLPAPLKGINGARVRLHKAGGFALVVSDFSGEAIPINRDNALAHAAVVKSILEMTTPLPFRFGTFGTEQQLESYVTSRRDALQAKVDLVRGCVEMSLKIIWDREQTGEPARSDQEEDKPGTAFLAQKRREILGSEERAEEAKKIAEWLEGSLAEVVRQTRIKTNPTEKLLLAAAHLVYRGLGEHYRKSLKETLEKRADLHYLISGPWAPYSFANIDLEFKFGVS
jgi:hypothetical protein